MLAAAAAAAVGLLLLAFHNTIKLAQQTLAPSPTAHQRLTTCSTLLHLTRAALGVQTAVAAAAACAIAAAVRATAGAAVLHCAAAPLPSAAAVML
jgi:hypothetical protein